MPTYRYRCADCDYEFEEFQRISDDPIKTCPRCDGHPERLITGGAGFVLKGSGFYSTDHRSDSYKAGEVKEKSDTTTTPPAKTDTASPKKEGGK